VSSSLCAGITTLKTATSSKGRLDYTGLPVAVRLGTSLRNPVDGAGCVGIL
jgi:hypothetical protein